MLQGKQNDLFSHSARYQDVTGRIICLRGFKIYNLTFRIYKLLGDGGKKRLQRC